jgi:hypothetical protein
MIKNAKAHDTCMERTLTGPKAGGNDSGKPRAAELSKLKDKAPSESPYGTNWTEIRFPAQVNIQKGVSAIMDVCGGSAYDFATMANRKSPEGIVGLFTVLNRAKPGVMNGAYMIDPGVAGSAGCVGETTCFWVSPGANLTAEKAEAIKAALESGK